MKEYEKRIAADSDAMFRFNFESKHPCFEGVSEAQAREIWGLAYLMGAIGATCSPELQDDVKMYIDALGDNRPK